MSEMWRNYGLRKTAQIAFEMEKEAMGIGTFFGAAARTLGSGVKGAFNGIKNGFSKVRTTFNNHVADIEKTKSLNAQAAKQQTENAAKSGENVVKNEGSAAAAAENQAADQATQQTGSRWKGYLAAGGGGLALGATGASILNSANGMAQQPMPQPPQPNYPIQG